MAPSKPRSKTRKRSPASGAAAIELDRLARKRALASAVRVERSIQTLARRLDREMRRTNDRLQLLALALSSHARALEAERDVDRSLAGESK
jgi:hypothetical protein